MNAPFEPNGVALLQGDDPEAVEAIKQVLIDRAVRARTDPIAFFEFVMREQTTRAPITVLPHQRVMLEFFFAHQRCVFMLPVGHTKTYMMAGLTLFLMGQDVTLRGAVVSATRDQAEKVLAVVRDYIETSWELRMVFPELVPSNRKGDPWTQSALTVQRPPGIPDPSLIAHGIDSGTITGSRLNWVIVDDILNRENTATKEQRDKVYEWFDSSVLSRLDVGPKCHVVVTNTPWHPEDLVHRLEKLGWATLRMDVMGNVRVLDDAEREIEARELGQEFVPWDSRELRPKSDSPTDFANRLVKHDPDPKATVPLWPERFTPQEIARIRRRHLPHDFNRLYMLLCRDDERNMCKQEYVDLCKLLARQRGVYSLGKTHFGAGMTTFTGVDLAISPGEEHDFTSFFTFGITPDRRRLILDIETGQWPGPVILQKIIAKQKDFDSVVAVENNAAQEYLLQFTRQEAPEIPLKGHTTGRTKAHPEYGIPGIFLEMANGAWLIPNSPRGECQQPMQEAIDACLYYEPSKHTPDVLMAWYFARELAREWGLLSGSDTAELFPQDSVLGNLLSR